MAAFSALRFLEKKTGTRTPLSMSPIGGAIAKYDEDRAARKQKRRAFESKPKQMADL